MSASTNVTILGQFYPTLIDYLTRNEMKKFNGNYHYYADLSLRECAVIVCGTLVMLVMSLVILYLAVKNRRAKYVAQRRSYLASASVNMENGFNGIGTPPPSYDTAVSGR